MTTLPPKRNRSGSEKRERKARVTVRLLSGERAALVLKSQETELSLASYLRACALGNAGPRSRRSPPVNAELLAQAVAALNRVGNNVNQIAHALNALKHPAANDAAETLHEVRAAVAHIRRATGRDDA